MIPAQAVEAAAKAFIAARSVDNFVSPQEYAEAMLESAAPYLMGTTVEEAVRVLMVAGVTGEAYECLADDLQELNK